MARNASLKMKPNQARRAGEQAAELLKKDQTKLQPRLEAGVIEGLLEDVRLLSNTMSSAITARVQKKAATQAQNDTAVELAALVMALRSAVKITGQSAVLRKALGVGRTVSTNSVKSVLAAANMVIEAYANHADEMRASGVLPVDVETVMGLSNALANADQAQEMKKVASKLSTSERAAVQKRVEGALMKIIAAAGLEFARTDPERVAQYAALIPSKPKRRKQQPQPAPGPGL